MNDLTSHAIQYGPAFVLGALSGAVILASLFLPSPSRLDKPTTTQAASSNRKASRVRSGGAR